jgi:adenylate kinase
LQLAEIVNQGKLVSDEIIFNLLSKRLKKGEDQGESGFILDGFPRTVKQAVRIFNISRTLPSSLFLLLEIELVILVSFECSVFLFNLVMPFDAI